MRHDYEALYTALVHASQGNATLHAKVTAAFSKATKPKPLAKATSLLLDVARAMLADKRSPLAARLAAENVTPSFVDGLATAGKALATAAEHTSGPRAAGPVTERDLDLQDGTVLAHMAWLYDYFGTLHAKDPSAPHLVAIATRAYFVGHHRAKAVAEAAGGTGDGTTPS